ncbi:hypothetical protein DFP72DRAFT_1067991 [Ephemerocybe angulata]|uniref:CxC2-like cysteine cluster KDZ transposase-associated domain-containing protein n=1 Tax=Ephemerocybe angulata TaxID=980116 RepID=A0A8H6HX99_9AGAR|nr:hypothetical protein DFP72DRAFT_1067991 [Tulosesus angulatus]
MPKDGGKSKKPKIKMSMYTPSTLDAPLALDERVSSSSRSLQTVKLKGFASGGFKVATNAAPSGICAPDVAINDSRTTEEILASWAETREDNGWDQAYFDSFFEKDLPPPTQDPENEGERGTKRPAGQGDKAKHEWTKHIDAYLRSLISLEGRGIHSSDMCPCGKRAAEYRCMGCDNIHMLCEECMKGSHLHLPLHRIQRWNGHFFVRVPLKSLGLRIQLGHVPGEICPKPDTAWGDDFIIIDVDGVHTLGVDYCACGASTMNQVDQLLERRLYPATTVNPKSAATFRVLEVFEILQYESKVSPFELYNTISRLTDNTGIVEVKDRYPSFLRMVHEWRHLKLLKRMMRGHDPIRSAGETKEGECALLCPPCPHPGINMAEGWEDEPEETRYIHALNLALDACFRLKRKDVSSDKADPGLSKGYSYFVEDSKFAKFLDEHKDEVEPKSTCSRHDAVNLADVSPGQGYAATGVATVECARHNMKRPSAVCDLQKGERYCNMDFIFHWSLVVLALGILHTFYISYDIACQWSKYLMERISKIDPKSPILQSGSRSRFLVPKFHLPAHIAPCQTKFAFMFTPGAGLGDGEAPERGWGEANPLAPSTREMGPGTRRDTLDYNFGDYNWRKIIDLGASLGKKMDTALSKVAENAIAHAELEDTLDAATVKGWTESMVAWERDPTNSPNPFEMTVALPTQTAVRRALADEEAVAIAAGKDTSLSPDVSPSVLVSRGIDIESDQRALKAEMKQTWTHSRDRELTRVQLRSNALIRRIEAWYGILQLYIPGTILLRQKATGPKSVPPYELQVWLPSQIGTKTPVDPKLVEIEFKLRVAQAEEALTSLRRCLQRRVTVYDLKKRWLRGQAPNTKALNLLGNIEAQIGAARDEYRQAREAILSLGGMLGKVGLEGFYLPLQDNDIRAMAAPDIDERAEETMTSKQKEKAKRRTHETQRTVSWIWRHSSAADDNHTEYEAEMIKVEWAKSRARAARYHEEIKIVREEMKRTIRFFAWKEQEWYKRADAKQAQVGDDQRYAEGLQAYAKRQGAICLGLRRRFEHMWTGVDERIATAMEECSNPDLYYARRMHESTLPPSGEPDDIVMSSP